MEICDLDPWRLVFVDEMGTHTSLAPLYAYSPIGQRAFFEIPRNRGKNTKRSLGAFTWEGWDLPWLWKGRAPLECLRPT